MPLNIDALPINLASGTLTPPDVAIQNQVTTVIMKLARATTATPSFWADPATEIAGNVYLSTDNGASFLHIVGFSAPGGVIVSRGAEVPFTIVSCPLNSTGPQRRLKVDVTVTNGPLISELTLETTT
jgi:hypothetical protein